MIRVRCVPAYVVWMQSELSQREEPRLPLLSGRGHSGVRTSSSDSASRPHHWPSVRLLAKVQ